MTVTDEEVGMGRSLTATGHGRRSLARALASVLVIFTMGQTICGDAVAVPRQDPVTIHETQLDEMRERYKRALVTGDLDTIMSMWREDGRVLPPGQPMIVGAPEIERWYRDFFAEFTTVP